MADPGFEVSLRTAALEALPLDLWQDHFETWIGHLILGTIGNPEEEHFRTTSIGYSAVRTSWETANQHAGIQWLPALANQSLHLCAGACRALEWPDADHFRRTGGIYAVRCNQARRPGRPAIAGRFQNIRRSVGRSWAL